MDYYIRVCFMEVFELKRVLGFGLILVGGLVLMVLWLPLTVLDWLRKRLRS